jgi:tetratricopeptide (TPR) repeat protein/tRNA A-37 threonylcarbamoyl transferase component Bud32
MISSGSRLGAYEIRTRLGSGGMGHVYRAWDPRLERDVAIKVLPHHLTSDPVARERLRREALAAAALDHPFICKIFEIGEHDDTLFVVMEHVVGETLHARLGHGPLPPSDALRIAGEIAEALEPAHARRIVHRDLKPSNVMLTAQGRVKVMDFGLAKQLPAESLRAAEPTTADVYVNRPVMPLTDPDLRVGTPDYMAPEQVLGATIDERSDLFAFGILLCELLTGIHPFRRASAGETMTAILREPPALTSSGASPLPGPVAAVLRRLLAKAPADRPGTIAEVRQDLNRLASSIGRSGGTPLGTPETDARPSRTMIGRDAEHAELRRRMDQAIAGQGSIVLIGGEPGIGKTRLTQALLADARERGCFAVVGHCYEGEGAPPYVPFVETLEYSARVVPPSTFRHALGDAAPEVAKLMPELRTVFPDIPEPIQLPPEQQRRFLFNAYREFLGRCCALSPLVVVLEDLHWADEPTLQLLQHVAQSVATMPLLIVGTYRDVELDVERPFAQTLESLLKERLASRISLRRLPASGVESMLQALSGQPPPSSLSRVVFKETEGNPFFVEEVFHHLAEDGQLFDATGAWRAELRVDTLRVPEGVKLVIGRRLRRLSETARRVLTTAAVIGRTFSVALLEALEPGQSDPVLDALEEAERAQLIAAEPSGRESRFRFTHELIRQTLTDALLMPRRQRLHARIAEALERVYATSREKQAPALAHHLYQAGTASDAEKTNQYLLLAADQARTAAAYEESLGYLDKALSLREGEVAGSRVADLHARRAAALRSLGRASEAADAFERAIALFDEVGDVENLAARAIDLVAVHISKQRPGEALRVADRVLERLDESAPMLRCSLLLVRASSLSWGGDCDSGFAALAQAKEFQGSLADPDLDRVSAWVEATISWSAMQVDRAIGASRNAMRCSRALGNVWSEVDVAWTEPYSAMICGRPVEGVRLIEERSALAVRVGHQSVVHALKQALVIGVMYGGDLDAAEAACRECMAFGQTVETGFGFVDHLDLGLINSYQGRSVEAMAHFQEAMKREPRFVLSGVAPTTAAWALAHDGDVAASEVLRVHVPRLPDELEREKARQRTYDAMCRKARARQVTGGSVFGYRNRDVVDAKGRRSHVERQIDETQAAVVREVFSLCANGYGKAAIAKHLNAKAAPAPRAQQGRPHAWAPSSVREVLCLPRIAEC